MALPFVTDLLKIVSKIDFNDGAVAAISAAGTGAFRYNQGTLRFEQSINGNAWVAFGGGGSSTLATAYTTGASQTDSTLLLDATRLGVRIRDNAIPITGALFLVQNSLATINYLSTTPLATTFAGDILPSGNGTRTLGSAASQFAGLFSPVVQSATVTLKSTAFDGSNAVAASVDTTTTWANSTAKLLALRTNGVEKAYFDFDGSLSISSARNIGTAQTSGLSLGNTTAATVGAQQYSPMLELTGSGWKTNATAGAQTYKWGLQNRPVQGVANLSSDLVFWTSLNGGAYSEAFSYTQQESGNGSLLNFGAAASPAAQLINSSGSGYFAVSSGYTQLRLIAAGTVYVQSDLWPLSDLTYKNGGSSTRWTETWSRRYAGVEQTVAAAATITLDPAAGETIRVTMGANITTVDAGAGYSGEHMTVEFIQDATTARTVTGFSASFRMAAYTITATLSKRDVLKFAWDATDSLWVQECPVIQAL